MGKLGITEIIFILIIFSLLSLFIRFIIKSIKGKGIESQLEKAKKMYDKKLISEEEYEDLKARLLREGRI